MNPAQRVVLLLLIFSIVAAAATGGLTYYRMAYLWGIVLLSSAVWSAFSLRGLVLLRSARSLRAQVGQVFEERFEVRNQSGLPHLWVEVRDESKLLGSRGSQVLTLIDSRQGRSYLARTRLRQRGAFTLGPTILSSGDLFGLFPVNRSFIAHDTLIVYPKLVNVAAFPNPAGLLSGGDALRRRTPQVTPNASSVREYVPGDPLSRIHWASTARRERFMVKEFELDPLADVWIFYDAALSAQAALPIPQVEATQHDFWLHAEDVPLLPTTEDYGVCIAASLARYYLRLNRSVGLVAVGQNLVLLPPDRGPRQLGKVLDSLAVLRAEGTLPLQGLLEAQSHHLMQGTTVVMITPDVNPTLALVADNLTRQALRPVAVLLDASTFGGKQNNDELALRMQMLGVPLRRVKAGDDLAVVLSSGDKPI
jgi:uncharacterized protein (DUF58 family)